MSTEDEFSKKVESDMEQLFATRYSVRKFKIKPGDRFGRLVVKHHSRDHKYVDNKGKERTQVWWMCACDCGENAVEVRSDQLKETSCCGQACKNRFEAESHIGEIWGELKILRINTESCPKNSNIYYDVECSCGTIKTMKKSDVVGDLGKPRRTTCGESCTNRLKAEELVGKTFGRLTVRQAILVPQYDSAGRKSNRTSLVCDCSCGGIKTASLHSIRDGRTTSCDCVRTENASSYLGEKNPNWNNDSSSQNQRDRTSKENRVWALAVLARDGYSCRRCGCIENLECHHILNFATHENLRFEVDNGVALCKKCHREFHSENGIKNNTREQLEAFLVTPKGTLGKVGRQKKKDEARAIKQASIEAAEIKKTTIRRQTVL
jgi:hypothetical protein